MTWEQRYLTANGQRKDLLFSNDECAEFCSYSTDKDDDGQYQLIVMVESVLLTG